MARYEERCWESDPDAGYSRASQRGGRYSSYIPDPLGSRPLAVPPGLAEAAARVERAIRALSDQPGADGLAAISRLLTRSEAISSSRIEGVAPSPQQVALAELAISEDVRGISAQAQLVANNIVVLRKATEELVSADRVAVDDVVALHDALLPDERHHGLRRVQNWIGGNDWNPIGAVFVPPPVEYVSPLIDDLIGYLNGATHGPLLQAGLVHAQFETIHPFTDGNGRVGRALIHTALARGGTARDGVLPVSLVLATFSDRYIEMLSRYRYIGEPRTETAGAGTADWLAFFVDAAGMAVEQARRIAAEVAELDGRWRTRLAESRAAQGKRTEPRADSATAKTLNMLPEAPVLTARTVERVLGVSFLSAKQALEELADAGVLHRKSLARNSTGYLAREILDLVTIAERRLASTRFDTRASAPNRAVPARPE
ncbi:MAG: Fic family protein [Gordonia sp. (in: high G+C Gram-positive bacteria)]|uniref:Fic family protein n=1 Tax=Gordonia sp. (in: high G+C Gram-positive bacteria) TaxID=84139 RepID=UPI0039E3D510